MKRRSFLQYGVYTGLSMAAYAAGLGRATAGTKRLTILHTNDTHSRLDPFPEDGRQWAGMGGVARRAAMIKELRAQNEHVLLLDAGDIVQGTPYFNFFRGEPEIEAMNRMGYDAATIGNHDFDNGMAGLKRMMVQAHFPFLCANYRFLKPEEMPKAVGQEHLWVDMPALKPYQVFDKAGLRIGVFGLGIAATGLIADANFYGCQYLGDVEIAKTMVQTLRVTEGADLVICLSHLGLEYGNSNQISDVRLATAVSGIDLILGGHTHTFLERPRIVKHQAGQWETQVCQVGWAGINLGAIEVEWKPGRPAKTLASAALPVYGNG